MENKFRSVCELCTALSFTAFGINLSFYPKKTDLYACMCSALIALFTLLANRVSDRDVMKKGICTGKYSKWSKLYRIMSAFRLGIETILVGLAIFLILAYFITISNRGTIFKQLAYYETTICIWIFMISETLLFLISIMLIGIEKIAFGQNTMDSLLQ